MKIQMFKYSSSYYYNFSDIKEQFTKDINDFIKNRDVIDIKYTAHFLNGESTLTAMVLYNEKEDIIKDNKKDKNNNPFMFDNFINMIQQCSDEDEIYKVLEKMSDIKKGNN